MIIDLPSTSTTTVSKRLIRERDQGGAVALGRVLTFIIAVDGDDADDAIDAANRTSHLHPCRVIALVRGNTRGASRLDAQLRVGGDAGASEVVVMRAHGELSKQQASLAIPFLLPDAPVVVWWPTNPPKDPATDPLGALAQRRITDASRAAKPLTELGHRAATYQPGDTDLAWTRTTLWRGLLAAALDEGQSEKITGVAVAAEPGSAPAQLLAGWLAQRLGLTVKRQRAAAGHGIHTVTMQRPSGPIVLTRPEGSVAELSLPEQPVRRMNLARRSVSDCLVEELRRLDPDEVYAAALTRGVDRVKVSRGSTARRSAGRGTDDRPRTSSKIGGRNAAGTPRPASR